MLIAQPLALLTVANGTPVIAAKVFRNIFLKRRLGLFASSQSIGLDQVPESLLPLLATGPLLPVKMLSSRRPFLVRALALSRILFKLHIRDRPY